jgi:hypothetical protein
MHDSARGSPEPLDGFHKLVDQINDVLGPCNGIDSAGIDVKELKRLMAEYSSNEADWERYAFADYSRGYTRNLVDNCNGKSNLVSFLACSKFAVSIQHMLTCTHSSFLSGLPAKHHLSTITPMRIAS